MAGLVNWTTPFMSMVATPSPTLDIKAPTRSRSRVSFLSKDATRATIPAARIATASPMATRRSVRAAMGPDRTEEGSSTTTTHPVEATGAYPTNL